MMNDRPASHRPLFFWLTMIVLAAGLTALAFWLAPHVSRERVEAWVPIMAGALYGPIWGPVLTSIGTIIGSTAAYWIGRSAGHEFVERWVGEGALEKAHSLIRGKRWIALIPLFLVPFSPADAICFMAGIVTVPWSRFTIAVLIGRLPRDAAVAAGVALGWNALLPPR